MQKKNYFLNGGYTIDISGHCGESIYIDLMKDRRCIEISKDNKGTTIACWYDNPDETSATIEPDEVRALMEFLPLFERGEDPFSRVLYHLEKIEPVSISITCSQIRVYGIKKIYT